MSTLIGLQGTEGGHACPAGQWEYVALNRVVCPNCVGDCAVSSDDFGGRSPCPHCGQPIVWRREQYFGVWIYGSRSKTATQLADEAAARHAKERGAP